MPRTSTSNDGLPLDVGIAAIVALLAAERDERLSASETPRRSEVVLAQAGLSAQQIANLLGKNYAAVAKTLQRAKG